MKGVRPNSPPQTTRVSSSNPRCLRSATRPADGWSVTRWREDVRARFAPELADAAGRGAVFGIANRRYCAIWPDPALLRLLIERMAGEAGVDLLDLPEGIRLRRSASHVFTFNYAAQPVFVPHLGETRAPASCHIAPL